MKIEITDNGYTGKQSKDIKLYDGLMISQKGNTGVLRKAGSTRQGGGHGEGTWYTTDWVIVTEDYRLHPLEIGECNVSEEEK